MPLKNRLPEIVQKWLDENGVSITKLAQQADINPSTLSIMLKKNPRRIDLDTVEKLRKVIKFELSDIIEEIGEGE
jgi:DNA-binding Xre family transcriptional regulator